MEHGKVKCYHTISMDLSGCSNRDSFKFDSGPHWVCSGPSRKTASKDLSSQGWKPNFANKPWTVDSDRVHYFLDLLFAKHWQGEFSWVHRTRRPAGFTTILHACLNYKERDEGAELVATWKLHFITDSTSFPQLNFIQGMAGGWTLFCLKMLGSWVRTGFPFHQGDCNKTTWIKKKKKISPYLTLLSPEMD